MIERYKGTLMSITPNEYLPLFSKSKILEDLENVLSFNRNASDTKKCLSLCNYNIEEEGLCCLLLLFLPFIHPLTLLE